MKLSHAYQEADCFAKNARKDVVLHTFWTAPIDQPKYKIKRYLERKKSCRKNAIPVDLIHGFYLKYLNRKPA